MYELEMRLEWFVKFVQWDDSLNLAIKKLKHRLDTRDVGVFPAQHVLFMLHPNEVRVMPRQSLEGWHDCYIIIAKFASQSTVQSAIIVGQ